MNPLRYRRIGYVALEVTDLDRSVRFYRDVVGLQLEAADGKVAYLRCSDSHHDLVLYAAREAGLRRVAFQLEHEHDVPRARDYLEGLGWEVETLPVAESDALFQGETIRFRLPSTGLQLELYGAMQPGSTTWRPTVAKIARLGHCVVRTPRKAPMVAELVEQLNFRVSDDFGDAVTFLRCFPNPYHHSFGVGRGDGDRFHHVNFMVVDIDDIGRATNRLRKAGAEIVFGPGRHDISDSIFLYFLDPDGLTVEYSFGMEEFDESSPREARMLPMRPEILDSWGGAPAPRMGSAGRIVAHESVKDV